MLQNGDVFPEVKIPAAGGGSLVIPGDFAGSYLVVLIYRGSWCPYCRAQLAAFGRAQDTLEQFNAKVVAFLVDPEDKAEELKSQQAAVNMRSAKPYISTGIYGFAEGVAFRYGQRRDRDSYPFAACSAA